jgi:SNF2-related domain/SNF2 Helicase protein/Helicase conserved C-terminal domain
MSRDVSRERAPFVAQGTWRSGALHVWGWNGESPASAAWLYSGFGRSRWSGASGDGGWHDSPVSYGELSRIDLDLPGGDRTSVPTVRLDAFGATVWLSDTPSGNDLSPSLAWFAALTRFARRIVDAGRVVPEIRQEGPFTVARWRPVLAAEHRDALAHAASLAPAVCRNGSKATTEGILAALTDGLARALLHHGGWRPDLGRKRSAEVQAVRGVFAALAKPDPVIRAGTDEFEGAVAEVGRTLERHRRRLEGEPVVRGRVRLTLPDDAADPWLVELELVDDADPGRWCSADDVWERGPRAVEVAGSEARLAALEAEVVALAGLVAPVVPTLTELATQHEPGTVELDLEQADDFLDVAPFELQQLGIELLGPEHLVKVKVGVRGTAREAPTDDRKGRFGKEALVQWEAVVENTPLSEAEVARIEAAGTTLMRTGNRWVRIDPAGLRRARVLLEEHLASKQRVGAVDLLRMSAGESPDGEITLELVAEGASDAADDEPQAVSADWVAALLAGLPDERLEEVQESPEFRGELRHYQRRGLAWMQFLARVGLGGCLADDMGLGKTATTLAHLIERPGPHLVVCPLSVVHNWEAETRRFAPGLQVTVHHGSGRQRVGDPAEPALFGLADADIVVTTYGLLPRDVDALAAVDWTTVVLDEAQFVKNASTKAAKAVRRLRAAQKLALTGTPVENRLSELWAILDAVNPGLLGSQQRFRDEYAGPIERSTDPEAAARLRTLTQPFVLRRTKADRRLLPDLPDKIEQIAYATLTREQAMLYQQVVDQLLVDAKDLEGMQRRGRVLAALTRLKQICNHPAQALKDGSRLAGRSGKLHRFDELVEEILDVGERALVFTQFREMGDLLQRHVQERFAITPDFLHGGVSRGGRDRMVAEFQSEVGPPLLLVSLKAGGTGLNLTAASQVIHYDRWWNPAVEDQATDRAWRLGQQRTVNVHKLVCQGTVEERIGEVIDEKRAIADAVIGTGEAWLSELSTDELARLVMLESPS